MLYVGDSNVKTTKLQSLRVHYEGLKMNDIETISEYFKKIDSLVNTITGLGEDIEEDEIVKKVLITLLMEYNPKVSTLEDCEKLGELTKD